MSTHTAHPRHPAPTRSPIRSDSVERAVEAGLVLVVVALIAAACLALFALIPIDFTLGPR